MQKILVQLVTVLAVFLVSIAPVFGFGGGGIATVESGDTVATTEMKVLTIAIRIEGSDDVQQIPLFSERYEQIPVATVNEDPITLKEFAIELATMHSSMDDSEMRGGQSFNKMLERLITIKLVKQEALNIGFDRTPVVRTQIENFALETMVKQLLADQLKGLQVDAAEVEERYQKMAVEAKLLTYRVFDQADAETLLADSESGSDFKRLADKLVTAKAEGGEDAEYAPLQDLFPAVAKAVFTMQKGDVGEIYKDEKGYMLFRLEDKRVYEDPEIRRVAANQLLQQQSKKKQREYLESLIDKYATFDQEAEEALNFAKIMESNPEAKGTEVLAPMRKDKRPLVTITNGQETVVLTVAEIAKKLEASLYHGADKVIDPEKLNREKGTVIWNKLVAVTGRMEAQAQGIDKSAAYLEKVRKFEERVLFDTFIAKAVMPEVKVPEEDVKKYYLNHLEDYSSPLMLTMKSLVFNKEKAAQEAFKKLRASSDFKWVSANSTGLADPDNKDILNFSGTLLAITALPEDLQKQLLQARTGDLVLYSGPGGLYYNLQVETVFPPKAKSYQAVRQEVGRIIYAQKINEALADWVGKLKEVYETKVFIVQDQV